MKKILILSLLYLFCTQYGVAETKKEQKTLGRKWQQNYVEIGRDLRAEKKVDCMQNREIIKKYIISYDTSTYIEKKSDYLYKLAHLSCPEVISFFEYIIVNDTFDTFRYDALMYLGWVDAQSSIPFLLNRAENTTLSSYEKACIGTVLAVLEDWENAEKILNTNCFTTEEKFCNKCIWSYYMLGNESSKKYYRYIIENSSSPAFINQSAQRLATLGDEKTTLPVFKKILEIQTDERIRQGALRGLEALDSRRSLKVIREYRTDPNLEIRKYANDILKDREVRLQKEVNSTKVNK